LVIPLKIGSINMAVIGFELVEAAVPTYAAVSNNFSVFS
jgi:hypothetical protein